MTDFIPFGTPPGSTGNPKSIIADEFQVGQKIKVATTAQVSGDTNGTPPNPSRVLTDEVFITAPTIPLPSGVTTYGMTKGAYASYSNPSYSSMSWITFSKAQFTAAGFVIPGSGAGNEISDEASAASYEDFVVDVALTSLAQFHVDGKPICVDIEDIGTDSAFGRQDLMRAARERDSIEGTPNAYSAVAQWDLGFYSDSSLGYTGSVATDWSVAGPLLKRMVRNIKNRIQAVYPNSPVGFYQVGPACWYTGFWSGCMETDRGSGADYRTGNIWQQNLKQQTLLDENYYGWQVLDDLDFAFYAYYLMSENREFLPFTLNPHLADGSSSKREKISTFFYWLIKYFGPSSSNWDRFGSKFMIGMSMENRLPNTTDRSGLDNIWTEYLQANPTQFPLSYGPWNTPSYLHYADVTGANITQLSGAVFPDLVSMPKKQAQDLIKWVMSDTDDVKPDTGWQRLPFESRLNPIDIDGNSVGALPDSVRDFKVAIWDGIYTGGTYSTGGANNLKSRYEGFGLVSADAEESGESAISLYLRPETFSQWVADGSVDTQAGFYAALQTYADNEVNEWIIPMFLNRGDNYSYSS